MATKAEVKVDKVPVREVALVARINRRLAPRGQCVRGILIGNPHGRSAGWMLLDTEHGHVIRRDVDLESLARELGAMKNYETMLPK